MNGETAESHAVIQAAGGLVWRSAAEGPQVLLVHRPRYDDWSLPKGKMEAGESWAETALREVEEETGHAVALADFAGSFSYLVRGQVKVVLFWHMTLRQERPFVPNEEVDAVQWLSPATAAAQLAYAQERELLAASVSRSPVS